MAKRKVEEKENTASWMITFTNLMILLLAFFIVLVNMGVIDQDRKRVALNSLLGSFGIFPGGQSVLGTDTGSDISTDGPPLLKEDVDFEKLKNIVFANGLGADTEIRKEPERIIFVMNNAILFDKLSTTLTSDSIDFLTALSTIMREGPGIIELRGYVDFAEVAFHPDPQSASLSLAAQRGLAVLQCMVNNGEIPVEKIVAHGFVSSPENKTGLDKKKAWDGQVEIIVNYKQKIPYRMRMVKKKNQMLDFKGFQFKSSGSSDE